MTRAVTFATLIERVNDQGDTHLVGDFGRAKIVGHLTGLTQNGNKRWVLTLLEPDERARDRRKAERQRRRERDGIEELGGMD